MTTTADNDRKPDLVFRVGVTGHRPKPGRDIDFDRLRARASEALKFIADEVRGLHAAEAVSDAYSAAAARLILVSPLAEGADQIVAEEALGLTKEISEDKPGYALRVIMPFRRDEYLRDFVKRTADGGKVEDAAATAAAQHGFLDLLARADAGVLELDGARDNGHTSGLADRSYESVGHMVVRNCDLLIALWDGKPAEGLGGTGDVVRYALRHGVQVWWISPDRAREPRLLRNVRDFYRLDRNDRNGGDGDPARGSLRHYIQSIVVPQPLHPEEHGPIRVFLVGCLVRAMHGARSWLNRKALDGRTHYQHFLEEGNAPPAEGAVRRVMRWAESGLAHQFSRLFARFRAAIVGRIRPSRPDPTIEGYYGRLYAVPDSRGTVISNYDRSAYLTIFALAAVALGAAAVSIAYGESVATKIGGLAVEAVTLGLIILLYVLDKLRRWHDRWIDYRFLAELFRVQHYLGQLGWSVPVFSARDAVQYTSPSRDWVGWYFHACVRAAPFDSRVFERGMLDRVRTLVLRDLVNHQIRYHVRTAHISERLSQWLKTGAEIMLVVTVALIVVKTALFAMGHEIEHAAAAAGLGTWDLHAVGTVVAVLLVVAPGLSAMFFAIRAQGEFEIVCQRSTEMAHRLRQARRRILSVPVGQPRASEALGAELFTVATDMLADVKGWGTIFHVKAIEAA